MLPGRRWAILVLLLALGWADSQAQEEGVRIVPGPRGPVIIRNGEVMPFRGPGGVTPEASGPSSSAGPTAGPPEAEADGESKPDSGKKPGSDEEGENDGKEAGEPKPPEATTKRPAEPPEPPDPEVLKVRPNEEGKVHFNFKGHAWEDVLQWIADISQMSLDWQELPEGYLNLSTQEAYTVEEARDMVNRLLLARGFTMLIQNNVISVCKVDSINPGMVPRYEPDQLADRQPYEFAKVSFALDWLLASRAAEELKPMMSPNGKLTALPTTNRLEAMDAVINLRQLYQVLTEEQSDSGQDRLVREFPLKNSAAEEVVEQLNQLLGIEPKSSAPTGPMTPQQIEAMKRQAQAQQEMAKKGAVPPKPKTEVFLLADTRHNSVVASAPPDKMAVIAQAIEILDVSAVPQNSIVDNINRIQVYHLENVAPEAVVTMIEQMGSLDHTTRLEVDEANHSIVAAASLVDHVTIRTLVDRMDRGGRSSVILPLKDLRAELVVSQIDFLMGGAEKKEEEPSRNSGGYDPFSRYRSYSRPRDSQDADSSDKFRVTADVKNNSLILWCNEFELRRVEGLLDQLRSMPKTDDGVFEVQVYRLNTLDPEPLVKTLKDMDALGVHASLEADTESKSIVAYATASDHTKIQDLIDRLDSSGRKFDVVQLRRLQADYVAGTIQFMMASAKEEQNRSGRSFYDYYDYYSRGRDNEQKDEGGFKVEADVENNRLLLLANQAEMDEVMNLLVKLGEIPAEGGDPSTIRVIDSMPGPDLERLLRQIEKVWPSVAPNPLLMPDKDEKPKEEQAEPVQEPTESASQNNTAERTVAVPRFRFAQQETTAEATGTEPTTDPAAGERPQVTGEAKAPQAQNETPAGKAPVSITVGPDGRLTIASEDTQALDRLEELLATLAPMRPDYHIFQLKYAWAYSVALTLEDIFEDKEEEGNRGGRGYYFGYGYYGGGDNNDNATKLRLSNRRPLKFISDSQSNSILVQNADPGQLKMIGELIEFYDQPEPSDSQSIRKTEVVSIKYSKPSTIAETVKDVYRDLLSSNDKALASNQQRTAPERSYTYVYDSSSSSEERKVPSFKGLLSLGVDDLSSTLIVSAPAYLIVDVLAVVEKLDEAAKPTVETVEVVPVGNSVNAAELQKTLMNIFMQRSQGRAEEPGKPPEQPRPGTNGRSPRSR